MKHVAKPTSNIKLMLMSRGDSSKKKKEVRNRGLCHVSEFTVYCFLQTSASLKDDPVLAGMLKEIGASGEVWEVGEVGEGGGVGRVEGRWGTDGGRH